MTKPRNDKRPGGRITFWGRRWTAAEDAILHKLSKPGRRASLAELASCLPGHTHGSIRKRKLQLGLVSEQRNWKPDEDAYLLAHRHDLADVRQRLDRSIAAIRQRLNKLAAGLESGKRAARDGSTTRNCMSCRVPFLSEGKHHRLCNECRGGAVDGWGV